MKSKICPTGVKYRCENCVGVGSCFRERFRFRSIQHEIYPFKQLRNRGATYSAYKLSVIPYFKAPGIFLVFLLRWRSC